MTLEISDNILRQTQLTEGELRVELAMLLFQNIEEQNLVLWKP